MQIKKVAYDWKCGLPTNGPPSLPHSCWHVVKPGNEHGSKSCMDRSIVLIRFSWAHVVKGFVNWQLAVRSAGCLHRKWKSPVSNTNLLTSGENATHFGMIRHVMTVFSTQPGFDLGPRSFCLGREWRSWHVWILLSRTPSLEVQKIWIGLARLELKWVWTKLFAQCQTMEKWHHQQTEQNP